MKFLFHCILACCFSTLTVFSQKNIDQESLPTIRDYIQKKEYQKANTLLETYYKSHKEDLETIWLYAQVAHWNGDSALSEELFQKAMLLDPKNNAITLDYARTLYENGKIRKVNFFLLKLKEFPETQAEALLMEGNIAFWTGHIYEAKKIITQIKTLYPENHITDALSKDITAATAPYLKTLFEYQHDNQPMDFYAESIDISQYKSWYLNPKFEIKNYNFTPNQQVFTSKLSNQLYLAPIGLTANYSIGIYKNLKETTECIGNLEAILNVFKHVTINAGYFRKPYLGTLESSHLSLVQNTILGGMDYTNPKFFSIHAGYTHQSFNDNNPIESVSAWLISKSFTYNHLKFSLGYGYSYSNSKTNLFTAKESLAEALTQFTPNTTIDGYYNPYFTPKNQVVHSALIVLNYKISKHIELETKGNFGVYATCENPYIFLDTDANGITIFSKDTQKTTFSPFEINSSLNCTLTKNIQGKILFTQQQTFFYSRNLLGVGLNIKL